MTTPSHPRVSEKLQELIGNLSLKNPYQDSTCEDLQLELESLQEALQTAPTPHKARLVAAIDKVLAAMDAKGCPGA